MQLCRFKGETRIHQSGETQTTRWKVQFHPFQRRFLPQDIRRPRESLAPAFHPRLHEFLLLAHRKIRVWSTGNPYTKGSHGRSPSSRSHKLQGRGCEQSLVSRLSRPFSRWKGKNLKGNVKYCVRSLWRVVRETNRICGEISSQVTQYPNLILPQLPRSWHFWGTSNPLLQKSPDSYWRYLWKV